MENYLTTREVRNTMWQAIYLRREALEDAMLENQITIADLAKGAGITRHTVRNALNGEAVSSRTIAGITAYFKSDFSTFFKLGAVQTAA